MVAQACEYTKNHYIVHFKMVHFMLWKSYLNFFLSEDNFQGESS